MAALAGKQKKKVMFLDPLLRGCTSPEQWRLMPLWLPARPTSEEEKTKKSYGFCFLISILEPGLHIRDQVDNLISTGESEMFLQKAIQEQGRGQVIETILIWISPLEEELKSGFMRFEEPGEDDRSRVSVYELGSESMDMAVLVESQGEQLDDIESHVNRANSFVRGGAQQLQVARKTQKNTRKWTCYGILLLLIIIAIIVLSIRPWK